MPAGQLGPLRSSSRSQTKSGIAANRSSVSAFGICRTGAEHGARFDIVPQD